MATLDDIALIDARIAAQATSGVQAYTIGDRSFSYEPVADLIKARAALLAQITRAASGGIRLQTPSIGW